MAVSVNGGALEFDAVINAQQFNAAISSIERQLAGLTNTAEKEASSIDKLVQRSTAAIAAYASFAAGSNFVADIVRVRGEFQQLEVAFETMLGSKAKADELLRDITEFAASTPFELQDVAKATKQLLAFGVSSDKVKDTLRQLGDVSAGIGVPLGDIAYLFGTIKTQGVALTQDVRQFANRGIPVYEELAKVLNVSREEVQKLIEAGKVGFPEIEQVFKNLTAEGSKFGGLMEAQSKTLVGLQSNLRDAIDQMLNDLGRSSEGVFASAIKSVTFLVQNYEKVVDILKILVITYGSYRAAIIATNVVNAIATAREQGLTVALFLKARALQVAEATQKLLNRTMLANPYVLVATSIGALVAALTIFGKRASEAKSKAELLADAQDKVGNSMADQEARIRPYVEALKNANLSEQERVNIYEKLKAIDPKIVEGLDAKSISYQNLTERVNGYLKALRNQYALEANKEALAESIKNEQALQKEIDKRTKRISESNKQLEKLRKTGDKEAIGLLQFSIQEQQTDIKAITADLEEQRVVSQELGKTQVETEETTQQAKLRTLAVIVAEIKAEKEKQANFSTSSKQYQDYQKKINALEEERKRITGATKAEVKSQESAENKLLALLERRKDLLKDIADRVKEAAGTNRTKEQSELDKINEKYDAIIDNIDEYNKKVQLFNKQNPNKKIQQIGQTDIVELNKARSTELDNATLRADAERFKKSLEEKQRLFEKYEEAKKQVGIDKANELFQEQTQGFQNFLQLLETEADRIAPKIRLGIANVGDIEKFKAITDQINAYNKQKSDEALEEQKRQFVELLTATATFNQQKAAINKKYDDLEATLNRNVATEESAERKRIFEQERKERLAALEADRKKQIESVTLTISNTVELDKFKAILSTIDQLQQGQSEADLKRQQASLTGLLASYTTFNEKRAAINKNFIDQQAAIEKDATIKNKAEELRLLKESREKQLAALNVEEQNLFATLSFGVINEQEVDKFKKIIKSISELQKDLSDEDRKRLQDNLTKVLKANISFNEQKAAINKKYDDLAKTIADTTTITDVEERKKILEQGRKEELDALTNDQIRKSALYKKLNQDILGFTRNRIKEEIKLLKQQLKLDTKLTPQQKADIQGVIDQYEGLLTTTNTTAKQYEKLATNLGGISGIFGELAGAVEGLNDSLADTLSVLGQITSVGESVANAVSQFASGNFIGGIANTVKAIAGIFAIGKKARESRRQAEREIAEFNQKVLAGEIQITQEYRNRQREQIKLNQLKLEGLLAEKKLLEEQKKTVALQYADILAQLQSETFVSGLSKEKFGGFLGIGRKTRTVEVRQTLAGLTFEEMEKLFAEGRLTGRAAELFQQLQAIKQEGADIDAMLAENKEAAKEIFTGTTANAIVDSIVEGFRSGKKSAADFADNFQELMRESILSALEFKFLEEPLSKFFDEFSLAAESDNQLTSGEIQQLQSLYDSIINNASAQFDQIKQISGLGDITQTGATKSSNLTGAIKGITETQADLLAGQFGGLRITALQILQINTQKLATLNEIQVNTGLTVVRLTALLDKFSSYETGNRKLHVQI